MSNRNFNQTRFSFIPLLTLISFTSFYQPVLAQLQTQNHINSNRIKIQFKPKQQPKQKRKQESGSNRGRPNRRRGMASRNNCPSTDIPLTALIPENNVNKVVAKNPTFWLFIPYQASKIPVGEFVLQDETHTDVYRKKFSINKGEGIVSIKLGSEMSLKRNKIYQWYFKIYCDASGNALRAYGSKSSKPIFVHGWVQRVEPQHLQPKQLNAAISSRQRVAFYAQNGIWYSALTELAKLRQANPHSEILARDWLRLLNDVGLQELSDKPIVGSIK